MFSLLQGFWQYLFAKPNLHVLIIGLDHAGKTTLLEKIKFVFGNQEGIPPAKIPPTVGMNCESDKMHKLHHHILSFSSRLFSGENKI
jgi:ABC-type phosphate/phosphonate transport system ATPase subunit